MGFVDEISRFVVAADLLSLGQACEHCTRQSALEERKLRAVQYADGAPWDASSAECASREINTLWDDLE